jgi:hypothetical protein
MMKLILAMILALSFSASAAFACQPGVDCVKSESLPCSPGINCSAEKSEKLVCKDPPCGGKIDSEKKVEKLACAAPPCKVPRTKKAVKLTDCSGPNCKLPCDGGGCPNEKFEEILACTAGINCSRPESLPCSPGATCRAEKSEKLTEKLPCVAGVDCKVNS